MTINTERLKTDAAYWDECGAGDHRYAFTTGPDWDGAKVMIGTVEFAHMDGVKNEGSWLSLDACSWVPFAVKPESTSRPTKPAEVEWDGKGKPPVGCECELKRFDEWVPVKITGNGESVTVFRKLGSFMEHITEADAHEFRPTKTPEQRQREELAILIITANEMCDLKQMEDREGFIAKCVMNRYNLEPK